MWANQALGPQKLLLWGLKPGKYALQWISRSECWALFSYWRSQRLRGRQLWVASPLHPKSTHSKALHLRGRVGPIRCWWVSPFQKTPSVWGAAHPWKESLGAHTAWEKWESSLRHFLKIHSLWVIKYSDSKGTQNPHISGEFYLLHIISNLIIQQYQK